MMPNLKSAAANTNKEHNAHKPARKRRQRIEIDGKRAAARPDRKTAGRRERVRPDPHHGGRRRKEVERMEREKIDFFGKAERLRELSDTITAAIIARRHAESEEQREKLNEILTRAYDEKYLLLGL